MMLCSTHILRPPVTETTKYTNNLFHTCNMFNKLNHLILSCFIFILGWTNYIWQHRKRHTNKALHDNQPDQSNLDLSSPNLSFYMLHELHHMNYNNHHPSAKENELKNKQITEQRCIQKFIVYWKIHHETYTNQLESELPTDSWH